MKIALIGGKGMLGTDLADVCRKHGHEPLILDLPAVDITNRISITDAMPRCECAVNCAAYTRVDDAEKEREIAMAINADGAGNVALACRDRGVQLLHISTDYIFNGKKGTSYVEDDAPEPLNYYGLTKLRGEESVRAANPAALIVRTQSLYGLQGRNFIKAILGKMLQGQPTLNVVNDQVSSPTYTRHLAEALIRLAVLRRSGIVHAASRGQVSWFDFARAVVERVGACPAKGEAPVRVEPLTTAQLNFPALRPAHSVLDTSLYESWTANPMPTWQDGLDAYLAEEPLAHEARKKFQGLEKSD
ncbi:MAG TPA: dTDP-4-dehydrorhamnose reductase [Kiritimatiellia bacterium]|jgi:dTDP-4-dehydrorhamnose reductase